MKYIMFESPNLGIFPVLFPDHIQHDMIGASVSSAFPAVKPTSAGFVSIMRMPYGSIVDVSGKSESLKLNSFSEDVHWIKKMIEKD